MMNTFAFTPDSPGSGRPNASGAQPNRLLFLRRQVRNRGMCHIDQVYRCDFDLESASPTAHEYSIPQLRTLVEVGGKKFLHADR